MSRTRELTADEKQRAWDLYAQLKSWSKVAVEMKLAVTTLRYKMGLDAHTRGSSRRPVHIVERSCSAKRRDSALYDPHRDGDPIYDNHANAMLLGDPPRGRRELLEAHAERTRPPELHPLSKVWHL